jgi:hypothetical protein
MDKEAYGIAILAAAIILAVDGFAGLMGSAWKNKNATQLIRVIVGCVFIVIGAIFVCVS